MENLVRKEFSEEEKRVMKCRPREMVELVMTAFLEVGMEKMSMSK